MLEWPETVVIGVGNTWRGDDAVGPVVAQRLQQDLGDIQSVTVFMESGEGCRLLEAWQGAEAVFLIDVVQSDARPGCIHRLDALAHVVPRPFLRCSTHAFGVAEAIELARALRQLPPRLVISGIEGARFEAGAELSDAVAHAVPEVVARVRQEVSLERGLDQGEACQHTKSNHARLVHSLCVSSPTTPSNAEHTCQPHEVRFRPGRE
jgi:hydrogenase maturation protease